MSNEFVFSFLDILGTFVFAISGAEAAKERELDLFGTIIISLLTACGGGNHQRYLSRHFTSRWHKLLALPCAYASCNFISGHFPSRDCPNEVSRPTL